MRRVPKSWIGKIVAVTWLDPSGFINSELAEVKLSSCVSIGTLICADEKKVILRTAKYLDSDVGDYSIITRGCCTRFEVLAEIAP
jgi:hypothetical protein|tara:strand:- start:1210 stop:1464 length:255 start_codon:yes stop_codon:yes gene_type:complete